MHYRLPLGYGVVVELTFTNLPTRRQLVILKRQVDLLIEALGGIPLEELTEPEVLSSESHRQDEHSAEEQDLPRL